MKNILAAIGGFFKKLFVTAFKGSDTVLVQLPDSMDITPAMIDHCINMVNIIKNVVNNPVTVLLTDLTPIQLDNTIRLKLAEALPAILAGLTYSQNYLNTDDKSGAVNGILEKVRLSGDPEKDALYHALCARLIMVASDGKVSWSEAVSVLEIYLKQVFTGLIKPDATPIPLPVAETAPITPVAPVILKTGPDAMTVEQAQAVLAAASVANPPQVNSLLTNI